MVKETAKPRRQTAKRTIEPMFLCWAIASQLVQSSLCGTVQKSGLKKPMAEASIPTRATVAIIAMLLFFISGLAIYALKVLVLDVSARMIPAITIKPPITPRVVIDSPSHTQAKAEAKTVSDVAMMPTAVADRFPKAM